MVFVMAFEIGRCGHDFAMHSEILHSVVASNPPHDIPYRLRAHEPPVEFAKAWVIGRVNDSIKSAADWYLTSISRWRLMFSFYEHEDLLSGICWF
jgi:hypothetical protein